MLKNTSIEFTLGRHRTKPFPNPRKAAKVFQRLCRAKVENQGGGKSLLTAEQRAELNRTKKILGRVNTLFSEQSNIFVHLSCMFMLLLFPKFTLVKIH